MIETNSELNQEKLNSLGLDAQKIAHHHKKIHQVLKGEVSTSLQILDECSCENGGILSWEILRCLVRNLSLYQLFHDSIESERLEWIKRSVITCIPAAGAATRYWSGASTDYLASYARFPKALLPATLEGDTFLDIKLMEQKALLQTQANVFIAPFGFSEKFQSSIAKSSTQADWFVLEQSTQLSTIRFNEQGSPFLTEENSYSSVPAGHGQLLYLFDDILKKFPQSNALHLRNIDNIIGIEPERAQDLSLLAESFYLMRCALDILRSQVRKFIENPLLGLSKKDDIYLSAIKFLQDCSPTLLPDMNCTSISGWDAILNELNKPLSVFGVVKKEGSDQGGGPVFVKTPEGNVIKICLEMSHANDLQRSEYFGEKGKLSYFNPVLVFFEMQTGMGKKIDFVNLFDDNFWLLSKRSYLNSNVYYYETVLYELIGNSQKTNLVFVEVPRSLFKPHKYFIDSIGKARHTYGL